MSKLTALRRYGKWARDDYPHSGWQCAEVRDDGSTCEMCEVQKIVYVHLMTHELLPGVALECGLICAGHMRGDLEYARLREALYRWQLDARKNKTPAEKLRRKGWRGLHQPNGSHEWTLRDDRSKYAGPGFIVYVSDQDGWRYRARRDWWDWKDASGHIHGGPFESSVEAATAGIERVELLRADVQWMAADNKARAAELAAWKARDEAERLNFAIRELTKCSHTDLAEAVKSGSLTISDAFHEQRRRVAAREAAR
jgi:hypothetical protein